MLAGHGAPIKVIFGYVSTARVLLALEQGEIDGVFTVEDSFARRQDLIKNKIVVPILQNKPTLPGVPLVRDVLPASQLPLLTLGAGAGEFRIAAGRAARHPGGSHCDAAQGVHRHVQRRATTAPKPRGSTSRSARRSKAACSKR